MTRGPRAWYALGVTLADLLRASLLVTTRTAPHGASVYLVELGEVTFFTYSRKEAARAAYAYVRSHPH